jgi:hypothetical protein
VTLSLSLSLSLCVCVCKAGSHSSFKQRSSCLNLPSTEMTGVPPRPAVTIFASSLLAVLGFELRASCWLGRRSTT